MIEVFFFGFSCYNKITGKGLVGIYSDDAK